MLDADDVNELATQLRNRDPQAEVTRLHMNRKHGIQTVTKALERNHECYDREVQKEVNYATNYSTGPVPLITARSGRGRRSTIYV